MSDLTVTKMRLRNGIWEGVISGPRSGVRPSIAVRHRDELVPGVEINEEDTGPGWTLRIPIPPHAIADGVQTFSIFDDKTGDALGSFTLIAGEAAEDDLRTEVELLRAELDMLKRAFRRHCLETT